MKDDQLLRYSRQIMLPQIDVGGQQVLLKAKVLIVGLGGLGSPVSMYLAAAGIGELFITDDDRVELSNLQRQIVHSTDSLGQAKTESAKQHLLALNPDIKVSTYPVRLQNQALLEVVDASDVVVDASDNFNTRFTLNAACAELKTPLVSGAVIRMEGQISVFDLRDAGSPCYRCLYKDSEELLERCSETGVLAPVAGIIGSIQATETIKLLLDMPGTLVGRLLILDAATMDNRIIKLPKDPACPVCGLGRLGG